MHAKFDTTECRYCIIWKKVWKIWYFWHPLNKKKTNKKKKTTTSNSNWKRHWKKTDWQVTWPSVNTSDGLQSVRIHAPVCQLFDEQKQKCIIVIIHQWDVYSLKAEGKSKNSQNSRKYTNNKVLYLHLVWHFSANAAHLFSPSKQNGCHHLQRDLVNHRNVLGLPSDVIRFTQQRNKYWNLFC